MNTAGKIEPGMNETTKHRVIVLHMRSSEVGWEIVHPTNLNRCCEFDRFLHRGCENVSVLMLLLELNSV